MLIFGNIFRFNTLIFKFGLIEVKVGFYKRDLIGLDCKILIKNRLTFIGYVIGAYKVRFFASQSIPYK